MIFIFPPLIVSNPQAPWDDLWEDSHSGVTGGGGGGECPLTLLTGKFLLTYREKRSKEKKGKWRRKEGKSKKGRWKIENGRGEKLEMRRWFFFFALQFLKPLKWFLVYQYGNFLPEKAFHAGKKWLCPLWKIFLLRLFCLSVWAID